MSEIEERRLFPHAVPRGPLVSEFDEVLRWVYEHERRGEQVSERLAEVVRRLEFRAWMRGNDHLPIEDDEAS